MNIIFISDDPREADLLKQELAKQAPAIQVEASSMQDALSRTGASISCDAILLDTSLPREDTVNLVSGIRREKKPIGIVALADAADKNPPIDLFKAGVDNFILKRAGYVSLLGESLKQAKERHKSDLVHPARQSRLLYAGDIEKIQPHLASLPRFTVEPVTFAPDGLLKLPNIGSPQDEVLVIDRAAAGSNTLNAIKDVSLRTPDIPIILLTEPGDEEITVEAMRAGAADCVVKTENYFLRLFPAVERELKHRESVRERTALRAREERLRQIVESMPVGVTVIAQDGTFLAINRAGLKLMGATRLEQIVGKNFVQLLPREEREKILGFLSTVSKGTGASIRLDWKGLDGSISGAELRAVPIRRDPTGITAALAAIYPPAAGQSDQATDEETQTKLEELNKSLMESDARIRELQDKSSFERSRFEEVLREIESRCAAAEEKQTILKIAAEGAEARYQELLEVQKAERVSWEQAREELNEQCSKIDGMAQSLRTAQASLIETHSAERTDWEARIQEAEKKRAAAEEQLAQLSEILNSQSSSLDSIRLELEQRAQAAENAGAAMEASLRDVEARFAQQAEELNAERSQRDAVRLEFEQKLQDVENTRAALEASLRDADTRLTQQAEELNAECSQHDAARLEFEQKLQDVENTRAALEASLRYSEARFAQQAEELNAECSQRDAARLEFEQKLQEVENTRAALETSLRETEARFAQQADELNAERSQHDAVCSEFEQKLQDVENTRAALEASLRDADARLTQQAEELNAECSQHDAARLEFEQKLQDVENTRAALETSLRDADARFAQQADELNAERSQRDAVCSEFEQKLQDAENTRAALESSLRDADARFAQQADELNAERSQRDAVCLEFEQKLQNVENTRAALEASLRYSEARFAQQADELNAERSQHDAVCSEFEQKYRRAEEQQSLLQTALQEAELVLAHSTEEHISERAQWDDVRTELEKKKIEAEDQRASLQIALDEVESYLTQQVENHNAERSQWNYDRLELEQKYLTSEEQRSALQNAVQEAESALTVKIRDHNEELSKLQSVRLELEQKCQAAELEQTALRNALQEKESRCVLMSEEDRGKSELLEKTLQDIQQLQAELRRLNDELTDARLRYHALSQLSSAGVILATLEGQVLQCNDSAARMFGYAGAEEAQAQATAGQFHLYAFEGALKNRLLQDGKLENIEWSSLTHDGRLIRIQESSKVVVASAKDNAGVERILTDISKIHRLGEEIRRARRMESTTDLATATIKSLQELCSALAQRGESLMESAEDENKVRSVADALLNDAKRGIKHACQFFSATQKVERVPELLDLSEVLANSDVLLHNLLGEDIDLQTNLSQRIGLVSANRQELVQLISNLMASSREALPLGGAVTIETANIEVEPLASDHPANMQPGTYVLVKIAADGCSVYPERRIGSIQTIVERMGGWLETANNTQAGNIYKIYLPRVEAFGRQSDPSS